MDTMWVLIALVLPFNGGPFETVTWSFWSQPACEAALASLDEDAPTLWTVRGSCTLDEPPGLTE